MIQSLPSQDPGPLLGSEQGEFGQQTRFAAARFTDELQRVTDSLATGGLPFYFVSDAQASEFEVNDSLSFGRNFFADISNRHPAMKMADRDKTGRAVAGKEERR